MKIKYLLPLLFVLSLWVFAEDCEYLRDPKVNQLENRGEWKFNAEYAYQLCLLNREIHADAVKAVQEIKNTKGKTVGEIIHGVGNTFCRGYFWECDEKSLYGRFLASCEEARTKTKEILEKNQTPEDVSSELIWFSYTGCPALAETYVTAYKEVALEEVARYHSKAIESSNNAYLEKSHEKWGKLSWVKNKFNKTFSNIAKAFQAFTEKVFV